MRGVKEDFNQEQLQPYYVKNVIREHIKMNVIIKQSVQYVEKINIQHQEDVENVFVKRNIIK